MLDQQLTGPAAWIGADLSSDAGTVQLDARALTEIGALAQLLEQNPLPAIRLRPDDFDLPACQDAMTAARGQLEDGPGFVIIDRLPLADMTRDVAIGVYWILMNMIGRPVAQKWSGEMIYRIADLTGKKPGNGIRPDITNAEQNFHNDNSYNICLPDYVALLCLQTAKSGGISRVVSMETVHNRLLASAPDLLQRLYQPFHFDRQREHAPDADKTISRPVFTLENGSPKARLSRYLIEQGYEMAGEEMGSEDRAALQALSEVIDDPTLYKEFYFEPGQIQVVDNRRLGHKRTGFEDWPEPDRRRMLIRLWLRDHGRPFYNG